MLQNKKIIQVLVSGLLALIFVNYYLKAREQNIENSYAMVTVLAAARDIPPGFGVKPEDFTTREVPLKFMEPGAVLVKFPGQEMERVKNKVTIAPTAAGAQIIQTNLTFASTEKGGSGVSPIVPPGKVGYILRLGNLDVGQLIVPGDHIDVLATFTVRDKVKGTESKAVSTILQNIVVASVGKDIKPQNQDVGSKKEASDSLMLTLVLSHLEAERLSLAQSESQGDINVVVRARGDSVTAPVPMVTPSNILGN